MVIDHFNALLNGGAAVAARRLHDGLRAEGIESHFSHLVDLGAENLDESYQRVRWSHPASGWFDKGRLLAQGLGRKIAARAKKLYYLKGKRNGQIFAAIPSMPFDTPFTQQIFRGDLLHLHWIYRDLDWPSFFGSMPDELPVVWTLHDMTTLTGGCHHAETCTAYKVECQQCPALTRPGRNDLSNQLFQIKATAYRGKNLHFVTPSRWLESIARSSALGKYARSIRTIHNGLDLAQFSPLDKRHARSELGLPMDGVVLAYGAESLENLRKGINEFLAALKLLPTSPRVHALMFGKGTVPAEVNGIRLYNMGSVSNATRMRTIYSAADIYVMPSHADNMPQTIVESLACGTPTVAFEVGGIPEIVRPNETGLLAPLFDVTALARQMEWLSTHPEARHAMGFAGRKYIEQEFDHRHQTAKYLALYRSLLGTDQAERYQGQDATRECKVA